MFTTSTYYWIWNEWNSKQTPDENLKAVLMNSNSKLFSNIAWKHAHETYTVLRICLIKVSFHASSAKGKALYQGKYKPGVNQGLFISGWVIYFRVTIPALCSNSPKLGFLKAFYRCQLTITWMSNIKGHYKPRLY